MTADVGERLLDDPVRGPIDLGRQRPLGSADGDGGGDASGPGSLDQLVQPVEPAARRLVARGVRHVGPQHVEGGAQLAGGVAARLLDGEERIGHRLAALAGQVNGHAGLHLDHRDAVGERVVQLPGDPQPLVAGPAAGRLLPRALGLGGPLLGRPDRRLPLPRHLGGDARGHDPPEGEPPLHDITDRLAGIGAGRQHADHQRGPGDRDGESAATGPHCGVHGDQDRDGRDLGIVTQLVAEHARQHHDQHRHRRTAAQDEDQRGGHEQQVPERIEVRLAGRPMRRSHHEEHGRAQCQRRVPPVRAPTTAGLHASDSTPSVPTSASSPGRHSRYYQRCRRGPIASQAAGARAFPGPTTGPLLAFTMRPMAPMSTSHNGQLVPWPSPIGPPTLTAHALRAAQATTMAAPRLRYDPFSRLMFFTVNVLYGRPPSLTKFLVLEHLARIPYQTWERVAQRAIARTEGRSRLALRIMERVVEARAQQDNEQFHLLIIDELLIRRGATPGRFRYRILPRLLAGPWQAFTWVLHLIRPAWSYRLNANFEDHAEHEYMHFVAQHPELDREPVVGDAAHDYGLFDTVGDLLRQIGHDERVHKLESLAAQERLRRLGDAALADSDREADAA